MTTRARVVLGILFAVIAAGVGIAHSARGLEPRLHAWVTGTLSESLQGEVQLESVQLNWIPFRLHGQNLTVRHHGRTDVPPLLHVGSFSVDLRPTDFWSSTFDHVKVDGLELSIPPKDPGTGKRPMPRPSERGERSRDSDALVVRHLTATNTRLAIIPRTEGKNAKVWDIFELDMKNLGAGESATFTAVLLNPIPYGKIESTGTFGPWRADEPGDTPLTGEYTFAADLGTIEGHWPGRGWLTVIGKIAIEAEAGTAHRLQLQFAGDGEHGVAQFLGAEAAWWEAPEQAGVLVFLRGVFAIGGALLIGL